MPRHADFKLTEGGRAQKIHHKKAGEHKNLGWYYDKDKKCVIIDFVWRAKTVGITWQ